MTQYTVPAIILGIILIGLLALMWWGWRRRSASHPGYPVPEGADAAAGDGILYAATTRAQKPLERVGVTGLRYRAKGRIIVSASGVLLDLAGERPSWIPAAALRGTGPATYVIDRAVEADGLACITWQLPDGQTVVDSYLRVSDPARREAVLASITAIVPSHSATESEA